MEQREEVSETTNVIREDPNKDHLTEDSPRDAGDDEDEQNSNSDDSDESEDVSLTSVENDESEIDYSDFETQAEDDEDESEVDYGESASQVDENEIAWFDPDGVFQTQVDNDERKSDWSLSDGNHEWQGDQEENIILCEEEERGNEGLFILDALLLDIFQHILEPSVEAMEESFIQITGHNFDDLHDRFLQTELGSQGIEDFIENDSRLLQVQDSVVDSKFPYHPEPQNGGKQVLDLSNRHITSCRALVDECLQARNASHATLRQSTISESATLWPVGVLDLLCWFCPSVSWIDVTGCRGFSKDIFSNMGNQSKIKIIDCFDPLSILNVSNSSQLIREMVEGKLFSLRSNSMGWSLLHSAILLGDVGLVKQLLQSEDTAGNEKTRDEIDVLQTSLELATALHDHEMVQLLRYENTFFIQPLRLVQLCFLTQDGIESFEHPVEVLTSNETASRAIRNRHHSRHCNLIALLRQFCENGDVDFKKKALEEIFQKVYAFSGSDFRLFFPCWNENSICDVVQILMEETGCSADGKIGSWPYIMFALPSLPLLRLLLQKGAKIDDKDEKGRTALFHAVEKALKSPSQLYSSFNDVIKFLLDNKANPNARNDFSETPLLYCLSYEHGSGLDSFKAVQVVKVWRLLLNAKARALAKNEMDRSLLHLFFSKFLKNRIFQSRECLSLVRKGLPVLRHWGFVINTRDAEGNTPLHLWASFSHEIFTSNEEVMIEIGNEIISNGGAVNARNDREETPLHLSQSWKQVEILVGKGSPLNAQDLNGNTPFHNQVHWKKIEDERSSQERPLEKVSCVRNESFLFKQSRKESI